MERYGKYGKNDENIKTRVASTLGSVSTSFGIHFSKLDLLAGAKLYM